MLSNRTFRLFISSTFSDFILEREALQSRVFPRLERYCAERGFRFQAVDLRWGITESAQQEHETLNICLQEIRRSQLISPRPNFVALLGDRYGWQPIPPEIPAPHWKRFWAKATREERRFLRDAYNTEPDRNSATPVYWLRRRTGDDAQDFVREAGALRALQAAIIRAKFSAEESLPYFASATHQEILLGALAPKDADEHVHVYIRTIEGLPETADAHAFLDWDTVGDRRHVDAANRLENLREKLRRRLPGRVHDIRANWAGAGTSDCHIDTFCELFFEHQAALIDLELLDMSGESAATQREREHRDFAIKRSRNFVGRLALLKRIASYARPGSLPAAPLVLVGDGGSGKSAILAHASMQLARDPHTEVLSRFVGGVPGSESLIQLLNSISADLAVRYGIIEPLIADSTEQAAENFKQALSLGRSDRPLVLFLDALDQLDSTTNIPLLEWLPQGLGPHTRVIASIRTNATAQTVSQKFRCLQVPPMSQREGAAMLTACLASHRRQGAIFDQSMDTTRRVTKMQRRVILKSFAQNGNPLWLKLASEEAATWRSSYKPRAMRPTITSQIEDLIQRRLVIDNKHPPMLTHKVLTFIAAGRFGIGEDELAAALGTDPEVRAEFVQLEKTQNRWDHPRLLPPILWARLFFDLQPYLSESITDGALLYRFFHREFKEVVETIFMKELAKRHQVHGHLAIVFEQVVPQTQLLLHQADASGQQTSSALRRIMEQPWHLARSGHFHALETLLANLEFCLAKCAANRSDDLASDFSHLLARQLVCDAPPAASNVVQALAELVQGKSHLLRRGTVSWPAHRILLQLASEETLQSPVKVLCEEWLTKGLDDWHWLRCVDTLPDRASRVLTLEGHTGGFQSFIAAELIHGRLLSRHNDYRVWNLATGHCEATYNFSDEPLVIACSPGRPTDTERRLRLASGRNVLWVVGPQVLRFRECGWEGESICHAIELKDGRIAMREGDNSVLVIDALDDLVPPVRLAGHDGAIIGFAELSGGEIISWSEDTTVKIWETNRGSCLRSLNSLGSAALGVLQIPGNRLVSWDERGSFFLTDWLDGSARPLEGFGSHAPGDPYTTISDARAIGALWLPDGESARLLAWSKTHLNWYDESGGLLHSCTNEEHQELVYIPSVGVARINVARINNESGPRIVITGLSGEELAEVYEDEAKHVSGLIRLDNGHLATWTGYKGGDDTLRIWEPVDGDWRRGLQLANRVETYSRWIYNVVGISGGRIVSCSEDDALRVWNMANLLSATGDDPDQEKNYPSLSDLDATDLWPAGDGLWQVLNFNYSKTSRPLVLIDALNATIKVIDDIKKDSMRSWEIQRLSPALIALDGYATVDIEKGAVHGTFEDALDFNANKLSRYGRRFIPLCDHLWLAWTRTLDPGEGDWIDEEQVAFGEITLWENTSDDAIIELGKLKVCIRGMEAPVAIDSDHFAVWGAEQRISLFKIQDEYTSNMFIACGEVDAFPETPSGVLALPDCRLAAWYTSGQVVIVSATDGTVEATHALGEALVTMKRAPGGELVCGSKSGRIWFLHPNGPVADFIGTTLQGPAGLNALVPLSDQVLLAFGTNGLVQRVHRAGGAPHLLYEGYGLTAGDDWHQPDGSVLLNVGNGDQMWFNAGTGGIYLLESNKERLALHDESDGTVVYWHFDRGADRDWNRPAAITSSGAIMCIAKGRLTRLQLMRQGTACMIN